MQATQYLELTGGNFSRAKVLEQIAYWAETTKYTDDLGRPVIIPRLARMAEHLRMSKGYLSKLIKWLGDQGYLSIRRLTIHNQPRLQIRLLVRLRKHLGNTQGNTEETVYTPDTLKDNPPILASAPDGPERSGRLKGKVSGATERLKEKQEVARAHAREEAPKPKKVVHEWNRLLREYTYETFDPDDEKHLHHINKTIFLFNCKTVREFLDTLEYRIEHWSNARPENMAKVPPHPWAINRTNELFADPGALEFIPPAPTETKALTGQAAVDFIYGTQPDDKAVEGSQDD